MTTLAAYPSDLTDLEYTLVLPLLPRQNKDRRQLGLDLRALLNAVLFVADTGTPWSRLPESFPDWESCYNYSHRWSRTGILRKIAAALQRGPKTMPKPGPPANRRYPEQRAATRTVTKQHWDAPSGLSEEAFRAKYAIQFAHAELIKSQRPESPESLVPSPESEDEDAMA